MPTTQSHDPASNDERAVFRRRHRLSGERAFGRVFDNKLRKSSGPITIFLCPNGAREHRLGLSVGRRVGGAVVRGRFKRMIREAFRLSRGRIPMLPGEDQRGGYDIVVTVRAHAPMDLDAYTRAMLGAINAAHQVQLRRITGQRDG